MSKYEELMQAAQNANANNSARTVAYAPQKTDAAPASTSTFEELYKAAQVANGATRISPTPKFLYVNNRKLTPYAQQQQKAEMGKTKLSSLNEQLKAAQERYGNVRRSHGTESYNAQEETDLKAQIDSYKDQIRETESELKQIEGWLTAYDNQIEGGKAWEDAQRRGLDSFAWYDETKGEYDRLSEELESLYKLHDEKAYVQEQYQLATKAGDKIGISSALQRLTQIENELEVLGNSGTDQGLEAAIRARDEAERLYGYAQQYRYASTPTGTGSIALGKAMARQLDEQRAREYEKQYGKVLDQTSRGAQVGGGAGGFDKEYAILKYDTSYMQPKDNWTEDELNTYYGLLSMSYGTGDTSSADEYARVLNDRKQAAANQEKALEIGENATSSFWAGAGHTVAAAGAGLLQGIEYLGDMRELSARGVITEKAFGLADYNAAVTGSISQHLNDTYGTLGDEAGILAGKGWGDAYNVAVSVGQSWAAMAITGGSSALVSTMFFGQAAKSTLDAQLAKGVDPYKAVTVATLSGVAEVLGEALPLENIRLLQSGVTKGYINDILRSAAIEGGEEVFTSFTNFMVDRIANGSDSAYYIALEGYVSQGMSYQEAQKAATKDFLKGLTEDFIAGSISGAVGGGVLGPAARGVHNATTDFAGDAQGLIDVAASYEGTKAASLAGKYEAGLDAKTAKGDEILDRKIEYFEKLAQTGSAKDRESAAKRVEELKAEADQRAQDREQGKRDSTLSIRQANRLTKAISEAQNQRNSESIKASIAQELESRGVENFQELAEIIHKSGRGKGLSDSEIKTLQSYRPAWQMREAVMAVYPKGRLDESLVKNGPEWMQKAELLSGEDIAGHAAYDRPTMDIAKGAAQAAAEAEVAEGAGVEAYAKALGEFSSGAVRLYDGSTDPREYITNMDVAINAVAANVGSREAFDKSESAQALTEEQRDFAWEAGQKLRGDTSSASQSSAPSVRGEGKGKAGKQQGKKKGPGKKRGGKVSSEGVTVDGVRYKSTTLDRVKPEDLRTVRALAETFDINVVFYESDTDIKGKYQGANGFYHKGTIYLDVHAGARDNTQKDAVLLTAAHELTHFIAENAQAEFKTLKEFVVEYLLEHGQDFENMVQQKMKAYEGRNKLDYEGAVEEVVADACEMVLKDSKAVELIRKEKPSLFKTIAEWLKQFAEDIRKAFEGMEARSREAKAMNEALEELTKLWDTAAVAAARNEGNKKTPGKGEGVKPVEVFSEGSTAVKLSPRDVDKNYVAIKKQLAANRDRLSEMRPAANISVKGSDIPKGKTNILDWVMGKLSSWKNGVDVPEFGIVELSKKHINDGLDYLNTPAEYAAFLAVPRVLKRGIKIDEHKGHGGNQNKDSYTFAAPVIINGVLGHMDVVVNYTTKNRYHVHRIIMPDGSAFIFKEKTEPTPDARHSEENLLRPIGSDAITISQPEPKRKFSLRDEVEATPKLVAVHNKSLSGLKRMIERGAVPFPSVAVKKAGMPHEEFGDVSIVFPKSTIDPKANKRNELYGMDAHTPMEPIPEDVFADAQPYIDFVEREIGTELYDGLFERDKAGDDVLSKRLAKVKEGDSVFDEIKDIAGVKYAYLKSIGKAPSPKKKPKNLDEFGRYTDDQLLAIFDAVDGDALSSASESDTALKQQIADALNRHENRYLSPDSPAFKARQKNPLYSEHDAIIWQIQEAYKTWKNPELSEGEIDFNALRADIDNVEIGESDKSYRQWVENNFSGLFRSKWISTGKSSRGLFGRQRSFDETHVKPTMENVVKVMEKRKKTGNGGTGFQGAIHKNYPSVEAMRNDAGRLVSKEADDMHEMSRRFEEIVVDLIRSGSTVNTKELLLDAMQKSSSKAALKARLLASSPGREALRKSNGKTSLLDELWQLKQKVENAPVPYFEAKPRRSVSIGEAVAYIVPDNTPAALIDEMESRGLKVIAYKAGNETDRLEKLNSLTEARFSSRDSSEGLTKEEARAQAQAYTVLKAENAYYRERWEWWKNQTRKTKVATVRKADTDRYARYLVNLHDAKEADLDWVKERLKALGDYFVQQDKDSLDYDEMWEMAWEVATEIAENAEAYEDAAESFGVDAEDVKDSIRRAEIYMSPSDIKALPEGFRKRYRGKIHISSDAERGVDSYYKELNASYGETLFPSDIINPEDQMIMIGEAWDKVTAEPKVYNPNKYHMNESINNIALDILNVFYGETGSYEGEIRTTPPSFADKAEAKLEQVKAEDREKLAKLRADKNARIEEIKREEVEKRKEMRAKEKAAKWDKYEQVKAYYQKQIADSQTRRKENAAAKKYRDRVFERVDTLSRWLQVNSDKEHIPEGLKAPVIELLNSLDLSSKQQIKGKGQTKRDVKYTEALGKLKDILANQQRYINSGEGDGLDVYLDLPSGFDAEIAQHIDSVRGILKGTDIDLSSPVVYMTADQIKDLDFILGTLTHSIRQINRFITDSRYASVEEGARETREYLKSLGERKGGIKPFEAIDKYVEWGNALPYYAFKRFGHAGMERFMAIAQGWGKMAVNMERLKNYSESVYKGEEARKWENTVHSIELSSGRTVQMSVAQMMGVWCMARREQGLKHLLGGGMRLADIEIEGGSKISQTTAAKLTQDDLAKIGGMLSDRQIVVATKLQQFMNTVCSDWGNEVSMARHGYRAFTEQFYYPITTDPNNHPAVDPQVRENDIFRLLNLTFTKALTPNANNSVVIFSVFDVFAGHATDMAKFNALALPILDLIKWYNHKDKIYTDVPDSMGNTYTQIIAESVQQSVETAYGKNAQMYVVNFLKDLNGKREGGRGEGALRGIIANYKRAAVAANLRVAAQQPTSIIRAAYAIAPGYIARGAAMSGGIEEALKYSGLAKWKDMGFFDTNIARGMREQIKHTEGTLDKLVEKSMELAKLGDRAVWGALWNAAKLEVRETQKLKGEELMEATARRFDEIILSTQVMDSTISRSDLMRNQSIALAEITSFMSEPTVSANILMDAGDNINALRRTTGSASTAARMGSGQAVKAVTIFALNAAATAAVAAIVDALRDDDEYQEFGEKWTEHVFENFKQNINPAGIVPLIGDIVQIFTEGETPDSLIFAPFTQAKKAVDSAAELWKLMLDPNAETDSSYTNWGRAYNIAQGISSMSGVPVAAGFRELKALWNISGGLITGKKLKFYDSGVKNTIKYGVKDGYIDEEEAVTLLVENGEASDEDAAYWMVQEWLHADDREEWTRYGELYAAMVKDDMQAFEEALDALAEHGIAAGTARSAVESEVKRLYQGADGQGQLMDKETSIKTLQKYGGMGELEARRTVEQWTLLITRGFAYEDIGEQFVRGNITENDAATLYKKYGMMAGQEAKEKVQQLKLEKDHGIRYSYLGDAYIYGEITEKQAIDWQMKYGGLSREEAEAKITSWDMKREYGVETGSTTNGIKAYLVNGIISEETAYDWLIADGNSPEKAEDYVYQYLFTKETGYSFGDIGEAYADKVITFSEMVEWYKNGSIYTHGSEEKAEEYATVEKWKATIPGAEAMNRDGLEKFEKYGKYMSRAGLDEADFAAAWAIYSEAEAQYDSQGNKVKEKAEVFFDELYELVMMGVYSRDEANAIARTMYTSKYINRYKKW